MEGEGSEAGAGGDMTASTVENHSASYESDRGDYHHHQSQQRGRDSQPPSLQSTPPPPPSSSSYFQEGGGYGAALDSQQQQHQIYHMLQQQHNNQDSTSYERITPPSVYGGPPHPQDPSAFPSSFDQSQHPLHHPQQHQGTSSSSSSLMAPAINILGKGAGGPIVNFGKIVQNRHSLDIDHVKLEKKRERNRIAATKCRQRKLEKISSLEKQVAQLKRENDNLRRDRQTLAQELEELRARLGAHVAQGACAMAQQHQQQGRAPGQDAADLTPSSSAVVAAFIDESHLP